MMKRLEKMSQMVRSLCRTLNPQFLPWEGLFFDFSNISAYYNEICTHLEKNIYFVKNSTKKLYSLIQKTLQNLSRLLFLVYPVCVLCCWAQPVWLPVCQDLCCGVECDVNQANKIKCHLLVLSMLMYNTYHSDVACGVQIQCDCLTGEAMDSTNFRLWTSLQRL